MVRAEYLRLTGTDLLDAHPGMDATLRNADVGHATRLSVPDIFINTQDEKLLAAVDSMSFDHEKTYLD